MDLSLIGSNIPALTIIGGLIGLLGTLVGAGGGFILVPLLVFLLPSETADRVTAISMAVVFFNALSGTVAYAIMRRIDFASGWRFAVAALPGAFLGAMATNYISRNFFDRTLGIALFIIAGLLLYKSIPRGQAQTDDHPEEHDLNFKLDTKGQQKGALISTVVGFVSSALGIGGGIIHVPALVYVLRYPIHIATATSHFVLATTAFIAVAEHIMHGSYTGNIPQTVGLSFGAVIGAQLGARLSKFVNGNTIIRWLAVALAFASIRIFWRTLS